MIAQRATQRTSATGKQLVFNYRHVQVTRNTRCSIFTKREPAEPVFLKETPGLESSHHSHNVDKVGRSKLYHCFSQIHPVKLMRSYQGLFLMEAKKGDADN